MLTKKHKVTLEFEIGFDDFPEGYFDMNLDSEEPIARLTAFFVNEPDKLKELMRHMFFEMFDSELRDKLREKLFKESDSDDYTDFLEQALPSLSIEDREYLEEFFDAGTFSENFYYWENFKLNLLSAEINK